MNVERPRLRKAMLLFAKEAPTHNFLRQKESTDSGDPRTDLKSVSKLQTAFMMAEIHLTSRLQFVMHELYLHYHAFFLIHPRYPDTPGRNGVFRVLKLGWWIWVRSVSDFNAADQRLHPNYRS